MDDAVRIVSLSRSAMYKAITNAFCYPNEEWFAFLRERTYEETLGAARSVLVEVYRDGAMLEAYVEAYRLAAVEITRAPLDKIQEEHFLVFGATISKECPPYETFYGCSSLQQNNELSKISGFYRAFGLEIQNTAGERVDHVAAELEYMRFLCYKEAYGVEHRHEAEQIAICVDAQKKFLREHLGKWVHLFAKLLKQQAGNGYYGTLAELLGRFISCEIEYLDVTPEKLERMEITMQSSLEDSACLSCGSGDVSGEFPQ